MLTLYKKPTIIYSYSKKIWTYKMSDLVKSFDFNPTSIETIFDKLNSNTKLTYLKSINQFLDFTNIGINQIHKITHLDIINFIESLKTQYQNSTVNLKINALKSLFKKLSTLYMLPNPFDILKSVNIKTNFYTKQSIDRELTLTTNEIDILLNHYTKRMTSSNTLTVFTSKRYWLLISLLYKHGLRISEVLNIKIDDITKQADSIYTIKIIGKGNKPRDIKITSDLYQKIIYLAETGFVFKTLKDKPMDRIFVTKEIKRVAKRVINKNISAHTLRHSFATNLLKMTNNIKGVSSYLGHSDISTTLRMYIHSDLTMDDLALI